MKRNVLKRYLIITAACAVYALGFDWCFDANHISVGGFNGMAQIINFFFPWAPVGTLSLLMNVPVFIIGWRKIGKEILFSALYALGCQPARRVARLLALNDPELLAPAEELVANLFPKGI